ncbi:MAG: GTP 3',8-cyclase MoaA [Clostridiales bacterium]|nr:GTP 3',8-cyclase MoaA [Clostridiales bacterium]
MLDDCGRRIDYLRISITDRCNLRCVYCMPEGGVSTLRHSDILSYEEIVRLTGLLTRLGVRHLRVTGGEPMARRGCLDLVRRLHGLRGVETIAMTTNALLLRGRVAEAREAGLDALNISLDTLDPATYAAMTRGGRVEDVLSVIDDAVSLGMRVKVNAVPVRGMNDHQLAALAALARDREIHVRFIELMPVGCGAGLSPVPSDEVLKRMEAAFGPLAPDTARHGFGPARYVRPEGFAGSIGVISPMSHEFCDTCNRVRLTADGYLKLCLNHQAGLDVRALLREGADDAALLEALRAAIARKPSRHGFLEEIGDREERRMNEIGG